MTMSLQGGILKKLGIDIANAADEVYKTVLQRKGFVTHRGNNSGVANAYNQYIVGK